MTERDINNFALRERELQLELLDAQNAGDTNRATQIQQQIRQNRERSGILRGPAAPDPALDALLSRSEYDSEGRLRNPPQTPEEERSQNINREISDSTEAEARRPDEEINGGEEDEEEVFFEVDVLDNPYSALDSANYRWSWFVTNPILTNNRGQDLREELKRLDDDFNNLANGEFPSNSSIPQKMIIAETGASVYNIESVELTQVVSPNFETLNAGGLEFKMQIREPGGISLADTLLKAGQLLLANPQKSPYFLELSFIGRDPETGDWRGFDQNGLSREGSARRWIYKVYLVELTSEYGPGGATHDLRFVATGNKGYDLQFSTLTEPISATHTRVADFFNTLANQMNKADRDKYGIQRNTFSFDLSRVVEDKGALSEWTIDRSKLLTALARRSGTQEDNSGDNEGSFQKGDNIVSIVDTIFANTNQIDEIHRSLSEGDAERESISYLFFVQATVYLKPIEFNSQFEPVTSRINELPVYDPIANDYDRHIIWHVLPFKTRSIIKSNSQAEALEQKTEQQKIMSALSRERRIRKVYEHYHTGLNTEIINFEIKFDTAWVATIPMYNAVNRPVLNPGERGLDEPGLDSIASDQVRRFHDLNRRANQQERVAKNLEKYLSPEEDTNDALFQSLDVEEATRRIDDPFVVQNIRSINFRFTTNQITRDEYERLLQEQIDQTRQNEQIFRNAASQERLRVRETSRFRQARNSAIAENLRRENNLAFVEDLSRFSPNIQNLLPVSLEPDKLTDNAHSSGFTDVAGAGRSIYTSIANQAYSGMIEKNLLRINITIKGDPYWLGATNADNIKDEFGDKSSKNLENNLPKLNSGAEYFILRFNLPEAIDEETVQPRLGESNLVTSPYQVLKITHKWESGKWTSELDAIRPPNINIKGLNAIYKQIDVRVQN